MPQPQFKGDYKTPFRISILYPAGVAAMGTQLTHTLSTGGGRRRGSP